MSVLKNLAGSVISVVGATATGKTTLANFTACQLATQGQSVEIISADSRQVYKDIAILSGADVSQEYAQHSPQDEQYSYHQHTKHDVRLHGVGILPVQQEWSLAHFQNFVQHIMHTYPNSVYILVGGTGLYHTYAFQRDAEYDVPPNIELRKTASQMTLPQLQEELKNHAPNVYHHMTTSDQHNTRRLIRAWERAVYHTTVNPKVATQHSTMIMPSSHRYIGVELPITVVEERIHQRVLDRWQNGAVQEVEQMLLLEMPPTKQVATATGVREIQAYLTGETSAEEAQHAWYIRERQYAKRQLTWWKKYGHIKWHTLSSSSPSLLTATPIY